MYLYLNLSIFVLFVIGLIVLNRYHKDWSLARQVLIGLGLGVVCGLGLHLFYQNGEVLNKTIDWIDVVGAGYVQLLQMIVMPLILISILNAVSKLHSVSSLGKISAITLSILLMTAFIAAVVGILVTLSFGLTAEGLTSGSREAAQLTMLQNVNVRSLESLSVPQIILSCISTNPFLDLTGARSTSIISVVIFAAFLGFSALKLYETDPISGGKVIAAIDLCQQLIMKLVRVVMAFTPYGVFALMIKVVAASNLHDIIKLGGFLVASYLSIFIMFVIHTILVTLFGVSPWAFIQRMTPMLSFAFMSRSSAATIPLNIETQTERFGVPDNIASFSSLFGATIGQNGCAGIYPAMLAVMVAPTVGIPVDFHWCLMVAFVVTFSSIGVAGVGGGATFAALIVLSILGLPIELIALLISIEPLVDMARTALNVSGSLTAGIISSQILGETNKKILKTGK